MFSAVDYGRDLNVAHLTTRVRRHCIPVRQKHLSYHSTARDIRSPPPLATPSPAAPWPRGHVTWSSRGLQSARPLALELCSYHSTCQRWIGTAPWSSRWSQLPAPALRTQCSSRRSYSGRECMHAVAADHLQRCGREHHSFLQCSATTCMSWSVKDTQWTTLGNVSDHVIHFFSLDSGSSLHSAHCCSQFHWPLQVWGLWQVCPSH